MGVGEAQTFDVVIASKKSYDNQAILIGREEISVLYLHLFPELHIRYKRQS